MTENVEETAQPIEIEPGVTLTPPPERKHWQPQAGDITTYHTRDMSTEQLTRYGLQQYIKAVTDGE